MPKKKPGPKVSPIVLDGEAKRLAEELYGYRRAKAAVEKSERSTKTKLEELVGPYIEEVKNCAIEDRDAGNDPTTVQFVLQDSAFRVNMVPGSNTSISAQKLLELGVDPSIVEAAKETSHYVQIRVEEVS